MTKKHNSGAFGIGMEVMEHFNRLYDEWRWIEIAEKIKKLFWGSVFLSILLAILGIAMKNITLFGCSFVCVGISGGLAISSYLIKRSWKE